MDPFLPLPDDASLVRLRTLTRRYGELAAGQAGGSALLGGTFLLLLALVEAAGHGWRFTWLGALAPLPLGAACLSAAVPAGWLAARWGLRRGLARHFGWVEPRREEDPAPSRARRIQGAMGRWVFPTLMLGVGLGFAGRLPSGGLRVALVGILAGALHFAFPRLRGRLERLTSLLLFFAPALFLAGIQMAVGDTFLAYPVVGLLSLGLGLRDLLAFRRVARDLAAAGAGA